MADALDDIAECFVAAGLEKLERAELQRFLGSAFHRYEQYRRLKSRDGMPTAPELSVKAQEVLNSLVHAVDKCLTEPHLFLWLEEIGRSHATEEHPAAFIDSLLHCIGVARQAAEAPTNKPIVITYKDGTEVAHRKRTTTDARDKFLVPYLVGFLHLNGLRLREGGEWNLEALDAACTIIGTILRSWDIPAPDAGDTSRGEANQGRLRLAIKKAYDSLSSSLTRIAPETLQ